MTRDQQPPAAKSQALTTAPQNDTRALVQFGMQREQLDLLKRTVAKGTTDDEFSLFMNVAERLRLDPFTKQIYAIKRYNTSTQREEMTIQVGIDGYRAQAERSGEADGQDGPYWCGVDGEWTDVWLRDDAPLAARVTVYRKGRARGYTGTAIWGSYVQLKDGRPNTMWAKHGPGQLAKCAEALALRKAFPAELGGTHSEDELGQDAIDTSFTEVAARPVVHAAPASSAPASAAAASQATPPPPTKPAAPPARPPLSEDDMVELITAIGNADSEPTLRQIGAKVGSSGASEEQRRKLEAAYKDQLAMIRAAAADEGTK